MKRFFSMCLAVLMCLGLVCAVIPDSRAGDAPIQKGGDEVTATDDVKVNDIVTFGTYPYESYNDFRPIEWIVINKTGTRMTLLSRYLIETRRFHKKDERVTWQTSTLNAWLNDDFKNTAFTTDEQNLINGGITIPSLAEARNLSVDKRYAEFTPYAVAQGGDTARNIWWLRDGIQVRLYNGSEINCASVVQMGDVHEAAYLVTFGGKGVRPMVQIDFDRQSSEESEDLYPAEETGLLMKGNRVVTSADEVKMYDDMTFGAYPQDSKYDEPIHWIVIGKYKTKIRLMSVRALDCRLYNDSHREVRWESSTLYRWLNDTFLNAAFAPLEQSMLSENITLLNVEEAKALPEELRITTSTKYAISRGADPEKCFWWLKDSMMRQVQENTWPYQMVDMYCGSVVLDTGEVTKGSYRVDLGHKTIRPVIVIDLALLPSDLS
ncbi:MAG: hypothetical protein IJI82_02645 [Clostridia bacterium]|nr:hypothetical protein [Clostridia bacterium]